VRRLAVLALCLLAAAPAAAFAQTPADSPTPRASLPDLEDEVMCTICRSTLQLSNSPQADRERNLIRGLIAEGLTKEEIKDELVRQYGEDVLATPKDSGFDLTAWLLPLFGLIAGAVGVGFALVRWRRRGDHGEPPAPRPAGEEAERLDADLARYDL
jgi:cytochrome c-type biogenesis protein CcmH